MVKQIFNIILFLVLGNSSLLSSDNPIQPQKSPPDFLISHNPVRLLNFPGVLLLYRTEAGNAVGAEFRYVRSGDDLRGYGLAATYRLYPWDEDMEGAYIEPFFAAHTISDRNESEMLYTYGFVAGYQVVFLDWLAFGAGFGFEYFTSNSLIQAQRGVNSQNTTTLNPYLRIDFGIVF